MRTRSHRWRHDAHTWLVLAGLALAGCPEGGGNGISSGKADASGEGNDDAAVLEDASGQGETGVGGIIPGADGGPGGTGGGTGGTGGTGGLGGEGGVGGVGGTGGVSPPVCDDGAQQPCPEEICKGGVQTCEAGQWSACVGPAEVCDGQDNDCDGTIDNGFDGLGEVCTTGLGICATMGTVVCSAAGDAVQCNAVADPPAAEEICDGQDNDCDGFIDEDLAGGPLTEPCFEGEPGQRGVGACTEGVARCVDGLFGACEGEGRPGDELCNGLDDDCDGQIDDSPNGGPLVELCYTGPAGTGNVGVCRAGTSECGNGVPGPCVGETVPGVEICDGADNDCDGAPDDVAGGCGCAPGAVQPCYAGPEGTADVGICRAGRQTCAPDGSGFGACEGMVLPLAEVCDGADNDCNGRADDGIPGVGDDCAVGTGACARVGVFFCNPETAAVECGARPGDAVAERCNGLDDDCDGTVDNGTGAGDPCVQGVGACRAPGVLVCAPNGGVVCDAPVVAPVAELCDGVDNDCNGETDEGLDLGQRCVSGAGVCATEGVLTCAPDGTVACSASPPDGAPEVCDGLDNDCDGQSDEDNPGGGAECDTGLAGVCAAGTLSCTGGELRCVAGLQPRPEVCDGLDNDCNGTADDAGDGRVLSADCYEGPDGTVDVGACRGGVKLCVGGAYGACEGQQLPSNEICDTVDNDCDGETDELEGGGRCACVPASERPCYTGPEGTEGVGACAAGTQRCNDDGLSYGACGGEHTPEAETCDGTDNDCDGRVDDDVAGTGARCSAGVGLCRANGVTVCDGAAGEVVCNAQPAEPQAELCDGLDNDCDGVADDGLGLGDACSVGVGDCQNVGVQVCGPNGTVVCSAQAGRPRPEICDARDNDCDGAIDDGLGLGDACNVGVGACNRRGQNVCGVNGTVVCGAVAGDPQPEACDGVDNNCDGQTDEGNPGGGQDCDTGRPGVCARGTRMCQQGGFVCQQVGQPGAEVCDGLDNNCNGSTDEDAAGRPITQSCYSGAAGTAGVGPCHAGTQTCGGGRFGACVGEVVPAVEICDGLDNNCDGRNDNLPGGGMCACQPGQSRQCYTGPAGTAGVGLCRAGTQACLPDGSNWGACNNQVLPAAEVCDAQDNNCDATVDNAPGVGTGCTNGVGVCARQGTLVCGGAAGGLICNAVPGQGSPEICDQLDNDCDGQTDDVAGLGDACTNGAGACARPGNLICDVAQRAVVCNARPGDPVAELCDGVDNDCDQLVDDGQLPGVGDRCVNGVGDCAAVGATICGGAAGISCGAVPGQPVAESCDARDNDCDGAIDDAPVSGVGDECSVGVGACQRTGGRVCVNGSLGCGAVAGNPVREICDGLDNDCDGAIDNGLNCNVYRSCLDAYTKGFRTSGVFRLSPDGVAAPVDIWCDQATDNGGWSLVGSTRTTTLNDQSSAWYADLATLAPAAGHDGLWSGLRPLGERFDVRFACRAQPGPADAAMTVDLSFYRTQWYKEWTTGTDAESCFSENEGAAQDLPPPARRNNVANAFLPRGSRWVSTGAWVPDAFLEGEDSCGDTSDFTVDFNDRGMDDVQGDGTDWGEDDGARKCGQSGLADGQWFVFVRERHRTAVAGSANLVVPLLAGGVPAESLAYDASLPGKLTAENYESLFIGRYATNWPAFTPAIQAAVRQFGDEGGSIVTEWEGASIFTSGYDATYRYAAGAATPFGWINALIGGGTSLGPNTPITQVVPADPIFAGVPSPFLGSGGTEFFFNIHAAVGNNANTYMQQLATFPGNGTAAFPAGPQNAILRGRHCGGNLITATFDYQDTPIGLDVARLVVNLGKEALLPPPPGLHDTCRPPMRPNVMVCGGTQRDPATFWARGGTSFTRVNACRPDADTQALLVTRSGAANLDGPNLQAYLDGGGIVITEYNVSDEVFNLAFGTAVVPGASFGSCQDAIQPAALFNAGDQFWDDNRFAAIAANQTGCGFDMAAYPGITRLGGPSANVVSLAYRDRGAGRLWLVEADWQDTNGAGAAYEPSLGLMHYMITHARDQRLAFAGVRQGVPESQLLAGGFRPCWSGPYNGTTPQATVLAACDQGTLVMACRPVGQSALTLSAMGTRAEILTDVGAVNTAAHQHNGVTWYFNPTTSWGFAPANQAVNRTSCDVGGLLPEQRMCVHMSNTNVSPGYRCGNNVLNGDAGWERVFYERPNGL